MTTESDTAAADLLRHAGELRADAERLLGGGLLALAQSVGPAVVIGSVALDLMTRPDIDLEIRLPGAPPDAEAVGRFFDFGRGVATRLSGLVLHFQNRYAWPAEQVPANPGPALYWNIRLPHAGRTWKLDVFGLGPMAFAAERERVEALRRELAGADRLTVLRVKAAVDRRPEYGRAIRSVDVYEAVARGGVTTAEEFDAWLRRRRASRAICQ